MLTVITPTDGRPEAFAHLEEWLGAQDWPEGFRWVVSGSKLQGYKPRLAQLVVGHQSHHPSLHPLCANLLAAFDAIEGSLRADDAVLICEDDDFYARHYFGRMTELLTHAPLVGEGEARYYNVRTRRYRQLRNRDRASLAQTAFRPALVPTLRAICERGKPLVDLQLWREHAGPKLVIPGEGLHVSLKGLPGTAGVGMGHREQFGSPDEDGSIFQAWGIPEVYRRYGQTTRHASADTFLAPVRGGRSDRPWEGIAAKKPWEYRVTAAICHLDTPELLEAVIDTLRCQTERPYIIVVDAGSLAQHRAALERIELDSDDVEVHYLRSKGWRYASEPVAVAMDVAFARCETEFLYSTHTDVFLKRRDYLADLVARCDAMTPAIGYQMSPRKFQHWQKIVSHTATLYHMPTARRIGLTWSMQRAVDLYGTAELKSGWPDTEVTPAICYQQAGIGVRGFSDPPGETPSIVLIGPEPNHPYETPDLQHVRSTTLNSLYDRREATARARLLADAVAASRSRVNAWRAEMSGANA